MSLSTLGGRSSRTWRCAFQFYFTPFRVAEVHTIPRLRRSLQLEASIGWLEGNLSRSSEGRVSWPRNGLMQRTVAQWISADCVAASAFQRMLGARRVPDALRSVRRPDADDRCRRQAATEHSINIGHLVLHTIWNGELSSGKESQKGLKHRARFVWTPGQLWFMTSRHGGKRKTLGNSRIIVNNRYRNLSCLVGPVHHVVRQEKS